MTAELVVIGGGHNGLTTAALSAKRGRNVVLLEARDVLGGLAAADEFLPGYRSAGVLHDTSRLWSRVVAELDLATHGLERRRSRPDVMLLGEPGAGFIVHGDDEKAAAEIARVSFDDAEAFLDFRSSLDLVRPVLRSFVCGAPVNMVDPLSAGPWELIRRGLGVRKLGKNDMLELMRLIPMSVGDWLNEWFETDLLKAGLALPAVASTTAGPRSPMTNASLLLHDCLVEGDVRGGGAALAAALESAARDAGVELRTSARVERVLVQDGAVCGVRLAGGEELACSAVAASCDPKTLFLDLLEPNAISRRLRHHIDKVRMRGTTAQVLLALSAPLRFDWAPGFEIEHARVCPSLDSIERAADATKYRQRSETPALEVYVPTVGAPELAPAGHTVASVLVHFAPYDLEGGWTQEARAALGERVVALLEKHARALRGLIVGMSVRGPADIEASHGCRGGHLHHGEHALDQLLVRPAPDCARYATPIDGLFLCGSGSHPGGGLTCMPGAMAADAMTPAGGR